jgi:phosphate/sulfate permease
MFDALAGADGATATLLVIGLLVAFGFEFVNGFHDTANAVATVIYTRSMRPGLAVAWSGLWNALGVMHASTTGLIVAFSIVHLLPVDLLVTAGRGAGIAMVFSLLLAAVIWNLGTWLFGLPASSSHALIGSVLGVGLAASWGSAGGFGSGVNWAKAGQVLLSLIVSPFIGFVAGAILLRLGKQLFRSPELHEPARPDRHPPMGVRALLIGACTGVSFAHGSNDGQKGIGLIMLILIGVLPAGFALNVQAGPEAVTAAVAAIGRIDSLLAREAPAGRDHVETGEAAGEADVEWKHVRLTQTAFTGPVADLRRELDAMRQRLVEYRDLKNIPQDQRWPVRVEILRLRQAIIDYDAHHAETLPADVRRELQRERRHLVRLTEYAPDWVPMGVALALGTGTMIGWKRIVVTVGEKIGETPMSYAQGTAAQLVTAGTILAADVAGAPVSTTHILSSAIAGSMAAGGSGLQASTLRNIALAWVLTLPASLFLGAALFLASRSFVR